MKKILTLTLLFSSISSFAVFTPNYTICGKVEKLIDQTILLTSSGEKELTGEDFIAQAQLDGLHTGMNACVQGRVLSHDEILVERVLPFYIP